MTAPTNDLGRLLEHFPRAVCAYEPVSVDVDGSWTGLLVQLVYTRDDPARPGERTTFVAAHHPELGSLSYEMIDGQDLLTLDEWRAGAPRREGIWWTTATVASTRPARAALLWHDVLPLVDRVESVADAARLAEHLDAALATAIGARPRRRPGRVRRTTGQGPLCAEVEELERLLAQVDGIESEWDGGDRVGNPRDDEIAGSSPAAGENRTMRLARARITADEARRELRAARERVDAALGFTRDARDRVAARET